MEMPTQLIAKTRHLGQIRAGQKRTTTMKNLHKNKELNKEIRKTLNYLYRTGDVFEVCLIGPKAKKSPLWANEYARKIVAGWFDNPETAIDIIDQADRVKPVAIYCTLNPVNPALLARAENRLKANVNRTQDKEILEVRHLLVDADPVRPAGISSTGAEKETALELLRTVYSDIKEMGWPEPLVGDSGNGGHLIYSIDTDCTGLIPDFLKALDRKYSTCAVNIDTTVGNPARLVKIYGTMTRKGDSTKDRPHRMAKILSLPGEAE